MKLFSIQFMQTAGIKGGDDAEDLTCRASLPFIPRIGDMIAPLKYDDYREVTQIYWSPADGLTVYFKDVVYEKALLKAFLKLGWKVV